MSSILEALEKAEGERVRGASPGPRPAQRKASGRAPRGLLIAVGVVLLLLVNLAVWWFYLRGVPAEEVAVAKTARPAAEKPAAPPEPQAGGQAAAAPPSQAPKMSLREQLDRNAAPSAKPLIDQAQVTRKPPPPVVQPAPAPSPPPRPAPTVRPALAPPIAAAPAAEPPPLERRPVRPPEKAPVLEMARREPAPTAVPEPVVAAPPQEPSPPLVWELPQQLREKILQLKSSIHVYSERPEQRFVIINMRRYGEGDSLPPDDFRLQRIEKDGVVIDYGEGQVRLPRR